MDIESVGKRQRRALLDVRSNLIAIQPRLMFVRNQNHRQVRIRDGLVHRFDSEPSLDSFRRGGRAAA